MASPPNRPSATPLERAFEELRDVEPPDVFPVPRLCRVVEHDQAIGTSGRDGVRLRLLDVAQAAVIYLLARAFLHPHPGAAGPAAESVFAGSAHLDDPDPRDPVQDFARFLEEAVVPSEVARIVIRQELQDVPRRREATGVDEVPEELRMVDDLVLPSEVRVFVLQRVEAVRARRDDPRYAVPVQRL